MKYEKTKNGWTSSLIVLFFSIIPALLIWYFLGGDFDSNSKSPVLNIGILSLIAFSFIVFNFVLCLILFKVKVVEISIFNFSLPISIILMIIMLSYSIPTWGRALLVIFSIIIITFPINIMTNRYLDNINNKEN